MIYCDDGLQASFPPPVQPPPKERGQWRPPDTSSTTCQRCGLPGWRHRSHPPVLADEIDRAIYAAAFVRLMAGGIGYTAKEAIAEAEVMVELHRRARSGT